jgi:hypothetical protein
VDDLFRPAIVEEVGMLGDDRAPQRPTPLALRSS